MKRENPIPETKIKTVKELAEAIQNKKTILLASIKNIPAAQFQEISKKLRNKAIIKVPKKNLIFRAIDSTGKEDLQKLKEQITDSIAILFSDIDCFELSAELLESKNPAKAKAGQIAPMDIEIPEGPTELVPGPAISELGALGIQIQIEKGKIHIKQPKIVAKEGEKITQKAADIMGKLDIKPFTIGLTPLSGFDTKENKLYLEIKVNKEETLEELKSYYSKALAFAVEICHANEETIKHIISKAGIHEKALNTLTENTQQNTQEVNK